MTTPETQPMMTCGHFPKENDQVLVAFWAQGQPDTEEPEYSISFTDIEGIDSMIRVFQAAREELTRDPEYKGPPSETA